MVPSVGACSDCTVYALAYFLWKEEKDRKGRRAGKKTNEFFVFPDTECCTVEFNALRSLLIV